MSKSKKKLIFDIIYYIAEWLVIVMMAICVTIKVVVELKYRGMYLADIPAWAIPWLGKY
jgi:hypothetical protein